MTLINHLSFLFNGVFRVIPDSGTMSPVPVVDINAALMKLNNEGIDGYTSHFVLIDPVNTAYSLDGIHPNDEGYAIIANLFIETIDEFFDMAVPLVNTEQFRGQYSN